MLAAAARVAKGGAFGTVAAFAALPRGVHARGGSNRTGTDGAAATSRGRAATLEAYRPLKGARENGKSSP